MIRVAIIEDEAQQRRLLKDYLSRFEAESGNTCQVTLFESGVDFLENYHSDQDLLLIDIEMPVMDGLAVARDVRKMDDSVQIIFVTNMAQYAIHGYEVDALDYIVKPVDYYPFTVRMNRVARIVRENAGSSLLLPFEGERKRIPVRDILYVEVRSHTLEFYTYQGKSVMTGTMKEVEQQLSRYHFARCNSCYLVNLRHVTGVRQDDVVVEGNLLKISRSRRREFMDRLAEFYQ